MPQPNMRGPDGRRRRLDELLGQGFALIGAGVDPRETLDAGALTLWQSLGTRFLTVYPFGGRPNGAGVDRAVPRGLIECEDPDGDFQQWWRTCGGREGAVAIVRPDKFVFALVPGRDLMAATRELARQLHIDRAAVEQVSPHRSAEVTRLPEAA